MTLEDLIAEINSTGFLVNNLFQLAPDLWRANLRIDSDPDNRYTCFGDGPTPADALALALDCIETAIVHKRPESLPAVAAPHTDLSSIIRSLRPTSAPINRRF